MRAIVIREYGEPDVLELRDVPEPEHGPEDLLINVRATAVNRADLLQRRGMYPQPGPKPQFEIPGLEFANVREHSLEWAWGESDAFARFRGTEWMQEPCRSCPKREQDFGGCRCQAFALTGDARATDPVCHLSPNHAVVGQLALVRADAAYDYRR